MLGAISRGASGNHLAAFRNKIAQYRGVFIVNINYAIDAKSADFAAGWTPTTRAAATFFATTGTSGAATFGSC